MGTSQHVLAKDGELLLGVISSTLLFPPTSRKAGAGCSDTQLKVSFSQSTVSPTTVRAHAINLCHKGEI